MALIVEVINYQGSPYAGELSARFDENGGSIGRLQENLLVLPDLEKFVSRRHGEIRYENGGFVYTDVSSGGTLLCNQNRRLAGESVVLAEGDRLKIGEYELKVHIETEAQPFPELFSALPDSGATFKLGEDDPFGIHVAPLFGEAEPPSLLKPEPQPPQAPSFIEQADAPAFHESFTPPQVQTDSAFPEDFSFDDFLRDNHVSAHVALEQKETFEFPAHLFDDLGLEPAPPIATTLQPAAES
ncbi:MAG: FHA domain-containing protein, partial [Methylococcaceae bacterium]|nr:FHA domain-containing protein [Methylococcaceae bacterium]